MRQRRETRSEFLLDGACRRAGGIAGRGCDAPDLAAWKARRRSRLNIAAWRSSSIAMASAILRISGSSACAAI